MGKTVYDVLSATCKYDGNPDAHKEVISTLKKHGHTLKESSAWCSETVMAYFYDAGCIDLIGGYAADSGTIKKHAEKLGIWHKGSSGILPGDIVLYGSGGKTNHTEFAVGNDLNISGNYRGGCSRRKRSGRSIVGYVRPKYQTMPVMDNLQVTVCACDAMLDVYGSGDTRKQMLSVFGEKNRILINNEVTRVWSDAGKVPFDMAVYTIDGHAGKDAYRKKRLGTFATSTQKKIDDIYALRGKSVTEAAYLVIDGKFGTNAIRRLLLKFCEYDVDKVPAEVDMILKEKPTGVTYEIYVPKFWKNDPEKYGDCVVYIEKTSGVITHVVVIDTGMSGTASVKMLKAKGISFIDARIFSHDHSDHTGQYEEFQKNISIKSVYYPDQTGVRKYQKSYAERMDTIGSFFTKKKIPVHLMRQGDSFRIGTMRFDCIFQADASKLPEKDGHHFINNMSTAIRITLGRWTVLTSGDMSADAIKQMLAAGISVACDVFFFNWHSDRGAITRDYAKKLCAKVAFTQYHHKEAKSNGRKATHDLLRDQGALVVRSAEEGDINIYIDTKMRVVTESGIDRTFTK